MAAERLGLSTIGLEIDADAAATAARAAHLVVRADVTTYPPERFRGSDGLIASPPCQDFSTAGHRAGLGGVTGPLVWEVLRWAQIIRPRWIAAEQVPAVAPIWRATAAELRLIGYRCWVGLLDAADYGVAQNRTRAILIASADRQPAAPAPTHCEGGRPAHDTLLGGRDALAPWVSMADALGWGTDAVLRQIRGTGMCERHGERPDRVATAPAPPVRASNHENQWVWRRPATTVQGSPRIPS